MKSFLTAVLALILASCGGTAPAADTANSANPGASAPDTGATRETAPQAVPDLRPLAEPLPDGVLPDFEYSRIADMTTRVAATIRQVSIQVRGLSPNDAYRSLEAAFLEKGYQSTGTTELKDGNLTGNFAKGGEGTALTSVVASGGTFVTIISAAYDEETKASSGGFTGVLMITVNTP